MTLPDKGASLLVTTNIKVRKLSLHISNSKHFAIFVIKYILKYHDSVLMRKEIIVYQRKQKVRAGFEENPRNLFPTSGLLLSPTGNAWTGINPGLIFVIWISRINCCKSSLYQNSEEEPWIRHEMRCWFTRAPSFYVSTFQIQ